MAKKELIRCPWPVADDPLYVAYHDREWGVPVRRDQKIFEFLVLEAFQAGLSWRTILNRREGFRQAFAGFDYEQVATFTKRDEARLMQDTGIIRNRAKIESAVTNAQRFIEVREEFGTFSKYMWSWVGGQPIVNQIRTKADYKATSPEGDAWAKDLKKRGFKFLGPTVIYAHMQATGMVNDHTVDCFRYRELQK
ncbi:MAG: DNA-3-methyladenine glycosylase I [Pirellulales bacterium]|nr:DNA-3-methyladenine glycosylase I [Pirellulales bacterium]